MGGAKGRSAEGGLFWSGVVLWSAEAPTDPKTPKERLYSDSSHLGQNNSLRARKWLKSDVLGLEMTRKVAFWVSFEPLKGHFPKVGKVALKSLFGHGQPQVLWLSGVLQGLFSKILSRVFSWFSWFLEILEFISKPWPNRDHNHFWVHLAGPDFSFWGYPRMTHQMPLLHPSTQWNTEKTQRFFIWCVIKCRFDVASDAKLLGIIMVVVVFGPFPFIRENLRIFWRIFGWDSRNIRPKASGCALLSFFSFSFFSLSSLRRGSACATSRPIWELTRTSDSSKKAQATEGWIHIIRTS